jgi:nitroreductase
MKPYEIPNERKADFEIDKIFLDRWSPRAMSGEKISEEELKGLFEAARWAPSSSNVQPWRFLYGHRDTEEWKLFFDLLGEFNQLWCKNAGVLIVLISKKENEGKENKTHSFDSGSAWTSLALQARLKGLVTHGMAGFDYSKALEVLEIPKSYNVECMIAVGKQGEVEDLHENLRKIEKPNDRRIVKDSVSEGKFPIEWV